MSEESQSGTVLVEKYREAAVDPTTYANSYKGLKIHALPGLHEFTAARAAPYLKAGDRVLDLAAGSGAMSLRLSDMGCHRDRLRGGKFSASWRYSLCSRQLE
jgi:hypothetical protein